MHRKKVRASGITVTVVILAAAFLGSCSKPPTEEMLRAEKSLAAAQASEAQLYAADEMEAARTTFEKARKLVASRHFDDARAAAAEVEELAHQAGTLAGIRREKMKTEAERMIEDLRKKLSELRQQTDEFRGGKTEERRAKDRERLAAWEAEIGAAETEIAAGNLGELHERLAAIRNDIEKSAGDFARSNAKTQKNGKP